MPSKTLKRLSYVLGTALMLASCLTGTALGQADPPEHGAEGSYAPARDVRTREEAVRTPTERTKFVNNQVNKFERAGVRNKLMSVMAIDGHAAAASDFDPSSWRGTYSRLVEKYGKTGQVLYLDDFLKALYTSRDNDPSVSNKNVEVEVLLDGQLLKGRTFEKTLRERYQVPAGVAAAAVKRAKEMVKAVNRAAQ
jgi:hypothetical protein